MSFLGLGLKGQSPHADRCLIKIIGVGDHAVRENVDGTVGSSCQTWVVSTMTSLRYVSSLLLLSLAPLFEGTSKFMVVSNSDTSGIETGQKGLVEPHQSFVLPQGSFGICGDATCLSPWFESIVSVRVRQIAGSDFSSEVMAIEGANG